MLNNVPVLTTLPATDINRAKEFYEDKLGLTIEEFYEDMMVLDANGIKITVYERPKPTKADHTVMTFEVKDIENEIKGLKTKGVIFEDYDKGVLSEKLITEIVERCISAGIPTIVDPKKRNFLAYRNVSLFKPNKKELIEGLKLDSGLNTIADVMDAVQLLKKELTPETVLITLSEQGVYIESEDNKHHIQAHKREISDVSGAGDTVISVAALCYALGLPAELLAAIANLAGGIVCEYVGVVPIDKTILLKEIQRLNLLPNAAGNPQ